MGRRGRQVGGRCQSVCLGSGNSIWSKRREKRSAPCDPMKGLLRFLCNSFGSGFLLLDLAAQTAKAELQPGAGNCIVLCYTVGSPYGVVGVGVSETMKETQVVTSETLLP